MVGLRRFGLLLVAFVLALSVLVARLYDVQVEEHEVWAKEAANLTRSFSVEPYRRGSILDREGRVLVRDEDVYELEFVWRDFRRGHPLGQVAQVLSLVELRSVPLERVHRDLVQTAVDLVRLSPAEIDAFGEGAALPLRGRSGAAEVSGATPRERRRNARAERRGTRAAELHWYVRALLQPNRAEQRALRDAKGSARWEEPYAAIVGAERELPASVVEAALRERLQEARRRLNELAVALPEEERRAAEEEAGESLTPFEYLLVGLEQQRSEVEDAAADDLFRHAAGFSPQRLDEDNLSKIDLDWLRRAMYWDDARLDGWRSDRGRAFPSAVEGYLAGHAIVRAKVAWEDGRPDQWALSALASTFAAGRPTQRGSALPVDWWERDDIVVLEDFEGRFERTATIPEALYDHALPFQDPELRARRGQVDDRELLKLALAGTPGLPEPRREGRTEVDSAAAQLAEAAAAEHPTWHAHQQEPVERILLHWDSLLQERVRTLFRHLPGGVSLREGFVNDALEKRGYVVRDRESRPALFSEAPEYELVHLVTRHPDGYAGFRVRSTTRRVPVRLAGLEARPLMLVADFVIGRTRSEYLKKVFLDRPREASMVEALRQLRVDEQARRTIQETVPKLSVEGVSRGNGGIEGAWDEELRGQNGYRERFGLKEREEGREPLHLPAIDGQDVRLTLDIVLQQAWEEVLERPAPPPPSEDKPDRVWHALPVGAAVLMTVDGAVLVAASTPRVPDHEDVVPSFYQDGQRGIATDRVFRSITFQPPGSVVKPLFAAYALEEGLITAGTPFECLRQEGDPVPFASHEPYRQADGRVHCLSPWGHGALAEGGVVLDPALRRSCNAYFAALGERFTQAQAREACSAFGLGHVTGVQLREFVGEIRVLREDMSFRQVFRQRLANGLAHLDSTPAQIGRAYCALATGRLPDLRLVEAVGGELRPVVSRPLGIDPAHLATVRASLAQVVLDGTAKEKGLTPEELGFQLACKTGSADYLTDDAQRVPVDPAAPPSHGPAAWEEGDRKHAWLAGYFPAEDPQFVVVVYCHDTSTTSSRIATHVTRELLTHPLTRTFLDQELGQ